MNIRKLQYNLLLVVLVLLVSCGGKRRPQAIKNPEIVKPVRSNDSQFSSSRAYDFVKKQTDFGPRVPGSVAHQQCAEYLVQTLEKFGAKVEVQSFKAEGYDGVIWQGKNIIGSFMPHISDRVMLCAHWDSRFIAEKDLNINKQKLPIDGANDGASGVGVLLEIARQLQIKSPQVGVDIIFFDVEDQGAPSNSPASESSDAWCLGSKYWAKVAAQNNYKARWGVLLDMVGASDAIFMQELFSSYYAPELVDYVWQLAAQMGYSNLFIDRKGGAVTDDHLYVNTIAKIPCIDIIDYDNTRGFNPTWHTHNDNMANIDSLSLGVVGNVVLELIRQQ